MLYQRVFGTILSEFHGILRVFVNFADLLEIRGSETAQNTRSADSMMMRVQVTCLGYFGENHRN